MKIPKKVIDRLIKYHLKRIEYHDKTVKYYTLRLATPLKKWDRRHARNEIKVNIYQGNIERKHLGIRARRVPKIVLVVE